MKSNLKIKPGHEANVKLGDVSIPDEAFAPENVRVAISLKVPSDVLAKLRELAARDGLPYQTLMNRILRDAVSGNSITERLERIEKALRLRSAKTKRSA
jgi:uncharacterized protein (DUF4415 family)